jgi:predicted permease
MVYQILMMFGLTVLQNASFTLVSRARNSNSIAYHTIASVLSNGIWLLVIRNVVTNFGNTTLMITYLVGSVVGSISMHYIAMKYFEKKK